MKFEIDVQELFLRLKPMSLHDRGVYITHLVAGMMAGKSNEDWIKKIGKKKGNLPADYTPAFEAFWIAYPPRAGVKSGKKEAFKAWWNALDPITEDELLAACLKSLAVLKKTEQWSEHEGKYIPMASTYLNNRRWEDEAEVKEEGPAKEDQMDWEEFE